MKIDICNIASNFQQYIGLYKTVFIVTDGATSPFRENPQLLPIISRPIVPTKYLGNYLLTH